MEPASFPAVVSRLEWGDNIHGTEVFGCSAVSLGAGWSRKRTQLVDDGELGWVHFAPYGTWRGHSSGSFTFSRKTFDAIVSEFRKRRSPPQVDYNHQSLDESIAGPKPAAGWIHELEVRGDGKHQSDGLWGLVEWTKRAADMIKAGEYRFSSIVFLNDSKHPKTGKTVDVELFNAALTNDPFIDGQVPIRLERLSMADEHVEQKALEDETVAPLAEENAADATAVLNLLSESTGLDQAAVIAALLDKIDKVSALLVDTQAEDGTEADSGGEAAASRLRGILERKLGEQAKRIAELENDRKSREQVALEARVDALIESGNILPVEREDALHLFSREPELAQRVYANKKVPIDEKHADNEAPAAAKATPLDKLSPVQREVVKNLMATGYREQRAIEAALKATAREN